MPIADCIPVTSVERTDPTLAAPTIAVTGVTLQQGAVQIPAIQAAWSATTNIYVIGLQFEYREGGTTAVATRSATQGIAGGLWQATDGVVAGKTYEVWYRAVSLTSVGSWVQASPDVVAPNTFTSNDTATVGGNPVDDVLAGIPGFDVIPPGAPSGLAGIAAFQTVFLQWTNPSDADLKSIEIWESIVNVQASATKVGTADGVPGSIGGYARAGLATGQTRYYWVRAVDLSGNVGPFNGTAGSSVTTASLDIVDFPGAVKPVGRGSSLPTASTYLGDTFYLTTDQKLYRKNSSNTAWIVTTVATDISGQLTASQIAAGQISASHIAASTITGDRIAGNTITGSLIAAATIAADRLSVSQLSAISANIGTVTAGLLQNSGGTTFVDLNNARAQFRRGSYDLRLGTIGSGVCLWYGSTGVGIGSESRTNGVFALGDDGIVYKGSSSLDSQLGGSDFEVVSSHGARTASGFSGFLTTGTVTLTPSGNTGTVTYSWQVGNGISANAPSNNATTFSATIGAGDVVEDHAICTVTDTGSGKQRQVSVYVLFSSTA